MVEHAGRQNRSSRHGGGSKPAALHGIGDAAQVYAECIEKVLGVALEEFGSPEAVWRLQVKNLSAVVTIDAHRRSLHQEDRVHHQFVTQKLGLYT